MPYDRTLEKTMLEADCVHIFKEINSNKRMRRSRSRPKSSTMLRRVVSALEKPNCQRINTHRTCMGSA
jgi:hypothetical protein